MHLLSITQYTKLKQAPKVWLTKMNQDLRLKELVSQIISDTIIFQWYALVCWCSAEATTGGIL